MKLLTVVRHGKAKAGDSDTRDIDRKLAKRGFRQAEEMGRRLAGHGYVPDQVLISPSRRTRETAQVLLDSLGVSRDRIEVRDDLYLCSPGTLLDAAQGLDDDVEHAAVVGHNPGVSDLLTLLIGRGAPSFPTGAVAVVSFDVDRWIDAAPGNATLELFDVPS
jgi:phosphohistidine phosphatase